MVATVTGLWFPGAKLPQFDFNKLNGWLALVGVGNGLDYAWNNPSLTFVVGGIIHMIDGIIWAVIFGLVISPVLGVLIKPLRAMTPTVNLIWGVNLGLLFNPMRATSRVRW